MKTLRLFLFLLLSLTLPLIGLAVQAAPARCPLRHAATAVHTQHTADSADCCASSDAGAAPHAGCKMQLSCLSCTPFPPAAPAALLLPRAERGTLPPHPDTAPASRHPDAVWRPPQA